MMWQHSVHQLAYYKKARFVVRACERPPLAITRNATV